MHHNAIKAEIRKQLKIRYPRWQRLIQKENHRQKGMKLLSNNGYSPAMRDFFPSNFLRVPNCSKPSNTWRSAIVISV